ncbi:MAG TPA: phosphoribosylglycinamide formyltransferase [Bacteroidales bacterium]|nr:phosphoribosylglycinamide formyltransferase [Bacteroidales bacterium]
MNKIAIFASGLGTNAENLINYFKENKKIEISCIFSNNKDAYVIQRAKNHNIKHYVFDRTEFYNTTNILQILHKHNINFIILAGFLWLIPDYLIKNYPNRIINIHPALLPKYGGKGMYGINVHKAVVENNEKETGITIHYLNNDYDKGGIIFQAKCPINKDDTAETITKKVHALEYRHFPKIVEQIITNL